MDDVDRNKITSAACVHGQGQDEDQFQPIRANDRLELTNQRLGNKLQHHPF